MRQPILGLRGDGLAARQWSMNGLRVWRLVPLAGLLTCASCNRQAQRLSSMEAPSAQVELRAEAGIDFPRDAAGPSDAASAALGSVDAASTDAGSGVAEAGASDAASAYQVCEGVAAKGDEPLIDDFSAEGDQIVEREHRRGQWISYDDGSEGSLVFEELASDADGQLHVVSSGWSMWGAGFGVTLEGVSQSGGLCAYDASAYGGIELVARGQGRMRVRLATIEDTPIAEGGQCDKPGENCYDWPGAWVDLTSEARTIQLPFCALVPEGWGGEIVPLDPEELVGIHFQTDGGAPFELWLEQISFMPKQAETDGGCAAACPLEQAPIDAILEPDKAWVALSEELTLHTFEQDTAHCGKLTRRYFSYVPSSLAEHSDAPVLMALHGSGANAESFQDLMAHGGLDELAAQEGFIVVYGNAAPGAYTESDVPNSGAWRQDYFDDGEVDDVEYLLSVLLDLQERQVIQGDNPVFLTGLSNGGGMVMTAAKREPERFAGIAPFMFFDGFEPQPVPELRGTGLQRALFAYSINDPGTPSEYYKVAAKQPAAWAKQMGIADSAIESPVEETLPDLVNEGEDYAGTSAVALATRDSTARKLTMSSGGDALVQVLVFDGAGHFWPNPVQDGQDWVLDRWGFRNQDVDASKVVWEFFKVSLGSN